MTHINYPIKDHPIFYFITFTEYLLPRLYPTQGESLLVVDIVLIRCNSLVYDVRVYKIARSLKKKYSLLAIGWDREAVPRDIVKNYVCDLELCSLKAPHGKSMVNSPRMIIYYAYFWSWVFMQLIKYRPSVVHACDLDSVIPAYFYKVLFRKKIIFDVFDRYAMAFVPSKSKFFYSVITFLEEYFSNHADILITISEKVLSTFRTKAKRSIIIMNCPEDYAVENKNSREHGVLRIVYTGDIVSRTRGLENIIEAIKGLPNVELVIAGWYRETEKRFLDDILRAPNVKFIGKLLPVDALGLQASSDVIIGLYDPELQWHNITLPNKLFDTMMSGVPIITNVSPELVNGIGFGIIVQYNNIKQIKEAIVTLKDNPELRKRLGENGRKAFLEKYNWGIMEEKLFEIYSDLVKK